MADRAAHRQHLRFSLALHRVLAAGAGNACFSPYSIASALGMAYQAARGKTADELRALLAGDDPDVAKLVDLLRSAATLATEATGEEPVFAVTNTLWAWDGLTLNEDFIADLSGWFGSAVRSAPFRTDPEAARKTINADVAETTRHLIEDLIPPGAVDRDTVASLVNALYLKVAWRTPFAEQDTVSEEFHAPAGTHPVPTMRQVEQLRYAATAGWQAVVLPATGGVEAVVLLPDADLPEAEAALDEDTLAALLTAPKKRRVELHLPTLDLQMNASLKRSLQELGVRELFERSADLSRLSDSADLMVSDALHESVLTLDEQGLEGAAATALMIRLTSVATDRPVEVRVDRPFLLLVRHASTGAVYFLARVTDPS